MFYNTYSLIFASFIPSHGRFASVCASVSASETFLGFFFASVDASLCASVVSRSCLGRRRIVFIYASVTASVLLRSLSRSCFGIASVLLRSCLGIASVVLRSCFGQ